MLLCSDVSDTIFSGSMLRNFGVCAAVMLRRFGGCAHAPTFWRLSVLLVCCEISETVVMLRRFGGCALMLRRFGDCCYALTFRRLCAVIMRGLCSSLFLCP